MILWAAMVAFSGPVSKGEAMKVAERAMTRLGFYAPRAYGAWKQSGYWNILLKDRRDFQLLGVVDPVSGRFLSGSNRTRWPRDVIPVTGPRNPPQRAKTLAKMEAAVGAKLRLHKWGESWARRVEARYDVFVGPRLLMGDAGVVRAGILMDPDTGEAISFANVPVLPPAVTVPDRVQPSAAEGIARAAMEARVPRTAQISPPLPARPALYLPKVGKPIPVWRIRIDTEFDMTVRIRRRREDVLVNSQTGKMEAIVQRNDW